MIQSWSHSKLGDFEKCRLLAKLKHLDKIPEPERPLPPGKTEHANDRGSRIHDSCERYVNGTSDVLAFEAEKSFGPQIDLLRVLHAEGKVSLEGEWGMNEDWEVAGWKEAWLRLKLDVCVFPHPTEAVVIDYKGLPLDTPLPTPNGWTTMREVQVGDALLDKNGEVCRVTGKSQVKHLPNYRIVFDDTSTVECDEEHLWVTTTGDVKQVTELVVGDLIPVAAPLNLPPQELPVDPYVLGIWLADGKHTSGEISKPDQFIWDEISRRGYEVGHDYNSTNGKCATRTVKGLRSQLRQIGLLGDKSIPQNFLRASYAQRLDLLRGLFDGDGSANHTRKHAVLNTVRRDFAEQICELLHSLGQRPLLSPYKARGFGKEIDAFFVSFRPRGINPFLLPRKASKVLSSWGPGESWRRRIVRIEKLDASSTQCIAVDSQDHTFLCTRSFIPTHNTGRKYGNEAKHAEQLQLYQLVTFLRYPEVQTVTAQLWYLDQPDGENLTSMTFTRKQGLMFRNNFHRRGMALTTCDTWPANPNAHSCRWCQYDVGGFCEVGVKLPKSQPFRKK